MMILVIEDDKRLNQLVRKHLEKEGYSTEGCYDGLEGCDYIKSGQYALVILDWMLPGMDGVQVLKEIRGMGIAVPVIMLTALDGVNSRIDGLDAGADDYMIKPFDINELLARIRALLRRPGDLRSEEKIVFGDAELYPLKLRLTCGEKTTSLSKKEAALLECLFRNNSRTLSKEKIMHKVWGLDHVVEDATLDNYMHFIRRRLKAVQSGVQIKTLYKVGYHAVFGGETC